MAKKIWRFLQGFPRTGRNMIWLPATVLLSLIVSSCALKFRAADAERLNLESQPRDWLVEDSLQASARTYGSRGEKS